MYDLNKPTGRYARMHKAFVESAIKDYDERVNAKSPEYVDPFAESRSNVLENVMGKESISTRYISFSESVRNALVIESIYKIVSEAVTEETRGNNTSMSILRGMISSYVNETGYDVIMNRMKTASVTTSVIHNTITESVSKILEACDKSNPDTFCISQDMKDDFFKALDYSDSESISKEINKRVSDAMDDFITANTKDHEDVEAALQQAKEKMEANKTNDEELNECYSAIGRSKALEVRNRPKGVLHSMISAMCESVMKNKDMQDEFMTEGKLNMSKIIDRTTLMYTFIESLNTSRIANVDSHFIEEVIADLSK